VEIGASINQKNCDDYANSSENWGMPQPFC
jgi:hypothetical protein